MCILCLFELIKVLINIFYIYLSESSQLKYKRVGKFIEEIARIERNENWLGKQVDDTQSISKKGVYCSMRLNLIGFNG